MIIRTAHEDARLPHPSVLHQLKILGIGPNPGGDFRKLQTKILTGTHGTLILVGIQEKLALPDDALGPRKAAQHLVNINDLLHCKGRTGLLAVPESGVSDPNILRHILGHQPVVEAHLGHRGILKQLPV